MRNSRSNVRTHRTEKRKAVWLFLRRAHRTICKLALFAFFVSALVGQRTILDILVTALLIACIVSRIVIEMLPRMAVKTGSD